MRQQSNTHLFEVIFPSEQTGQVDGFLNRHQIVIVSTTKLNSARPQFPVIMSFVFTLVKYLHCLIAANHGYIMISPN